MVTAKQLRSGSSLPPCVLYVSESQGRVLSLLLQRKFICVAVSVVCFSAGAGKLSWDETVVQSSGEPEVCGISQVHSHSENPSAWSISLAPSQQTETPVCMWLNKQQLYLRGPALVFYFLPHGKAGEFFYFPKL